MNRKKMWLSIVLIGTVLVATGAATFAFFSAQRTASVNKFTAGTMDLDVTANGNQLEPFVIENMGENGTISGTKTWTINNTGTLPGKLLFRLQGLTNKENGCNDQEKVVDPTCEAPGKVGDLGGVINLQIALDGTDVVSSTLTQANANKIGLDWNSLTPVIMPAGSTRTITAHWETTENEYGNEIQGDSLEFDANFRLIQLINGPTPTN